MKDHFKPEYKLGVPTEETAKKMFDELAYQRAVQVYLWGLPAVGMQQYRIADQDAMGGGLDEYKLTYLGDLMKNNIEHVTGNPDSMYVEAFLDTHHGCIALEVPPGLPGFIDDMWQQPVIDVISQVSPSGKYVVVPPGWQGEAPASFVVVRPNTYVSWLALRGGVEQKPSGPDTTTAVALMNTELKIYPLSAANNPTAMPKLQFFNISDQKVNRIAPEGLKFFERLAELVSNEPPTQTDAFAMGLMRTLGIEPGKPFEPDAHMTAILERAAETGQAMARTIAFRGNSSDRWHWPDRKYAEAFMGGSPSFIADGHVNHDARIAFFFLACGTSQLMASKTPGVGQAYPWVVSDADGSILDGAKTYKMHLPKGIPAKLYWSVTTYDTGTRSQIHNGTPFSRISTFTKPQFDPDGSIDLFFGPKIPAGQEANWIRTVPDQAWFFLFRLYGPEKPYFDLTWKPDDLIEVKP